VRRPIKKLERNPVVLRPGQKLHFGIIADILEKRKFALDTSSLGSGKTYIAMAAAQRFKLKHLIYISTGQIIEKVRPVLAEYDLPNNFMITFQSLRSTTGHQPKHGLLTRTEIQPGISTSVKFHPTKLLETMIKEGVAFIIDEVQNIKNNSQQYKAVSVIERLIINSTGDSKVIELSGLPANKVEHFINVMRRFRIITAYRLFTNHKSGEQELIGASELVDFCYENDPIKTAQILDENPWTKKNVKDVCFSLYEGVVQHLISHSMPPPESHVGVSVDIKNGYYEMSDADKSVLGESVSQLRGASGMNQANVIDTTLTRWNAVTKSLQKIEISKINMMVRKAKEVLTENPNAKVIFGLNYTITLNLLEKALESYGVIAMRSSIKVAKRAELISEFNKPNNDFRVLIGNMRIINSGIDLDDRDGRFPRYAFGSASYLFIECHQFAWRFLRGKDTKSNSSVRFMFGICDAQESSILNALAKSSALCAKTLQKQIEAGVKFPGEYEEDHEVVDGISKMKMNEEDGDCYDIGEILNKMSGENKDEEIREFRKSKVVKNGNPTISVPRTQEDLNARTSLVKEEPEIVRARRAIPVKARSIFESESSDEETGVKEKESRKRNIIPSPVPKRKFVLRSNRPRSRR
jgi:hypothetical protein